MQVLRNRMRKEVVSVGPIDDDVALLVDENWLGMSKMVLLRW